MALGVQILRYSPLLNLCQTNVYVYDTENGLWNVFPPSISLIDFDVSTKSVYLLHPTGHFDVVTSVRKI